MRLGRAEIRNGPNLKAGPGSFVQEGDRVRIRGTLYPVDAHGEAAGVSMDASRAFRQQWLALNGPDVDVVPLWFPDDRADIWDAAGYYRVTSARWEALKGATEARGVVEYEATLERIAGGFAAALVQEYMTGVLRANDQAVTVGTQVVAFPIATFSSITNTEITGTASGPIEVFHSSVADPFTDCEYRCRPEDFYNGAATVEVRYSDAGAWHPIDGLQSTSAAVSENVRIGNGLVRVTVVPGVGLDIQRWIPDADPLDTAAGSWSDAVTLSSPGIVEGVPVRIVNLSPTRATIEVYTAYTVLTVTVHRGDVFAHFASVGVGDGPIDLVRGGVDAPGELFGDGGAYESATVDGLKWIFGAPDLSVDGNDDPVSTAIDGLIEFAITIGDPTYYADTLETFYAISLAEQSVVT